MSDNNITYITDVSMLTCVIESRFSEDVQKAARSVGAKLGCTSHHAKGLGVRERLGILGIAIEAEKEIIQMMVASEQQDIVYDAIYRAVDLDVPGRGFIYLTPMIKASTHIPKSVLAKLDENK
jgi:nitrogen regulatory protein P-II 1